tara:strand:+ start:25312 stop:25779 length:468 start_codon:yes stop_codon:yes gene_type:complete
LRHLLSSEEKETLFGYMEERFGFTRSLFSGFTLERTKRDIWLMPLEVYECRFETFEIEKRGLRAFNGDKHPPKPTSTFLQRFGHLFTKNCVELSSNELKRFLAGEVLEGRGETMTKGYILIRRGAISVGCGFVREGNIETQFPLNIGRTISKDYL